MASIPDYRQQVAPGQIPNVQAQTNFSAQDFGGGLGAVVNDIGRQMQFDQDKADAYKAIRAARLDADELWTGEGGGRWKKGEEFFGWAGKEANDFVSKMPSRLEALSPGARSFAEEGLNQVTDGFHERILGQSGDARIEMVNGQKAADLQSISDSARLGATDPKGGIDALGRGLDEGSYRLFEYAKDHPDLIGDLPPEQWVAREVKQYESDLVRNSIDDALKAGQTSLAQSYEKLHGFRLLPDAKSAVRTSLAQASSMQEISDVYDFLQTGMPLMVGDDAKAQVEFEGKLYRPPAAQLEAWLKDVRAIGKRKDWSAKQTEDAVEYVRRRAADELDVQRAKQDEMTESIAADLEANGGDLLDVIKRRPAAFRFIEGKNRALLAKDAAAMAGARTDLEEGTTFLGFVDMAEKDPKAFGKVSEYEIRASVDDAHARTLLSMRKGTDGGIQSAYQILAQRTKDMSDDDKIKFTSAAEEMWQAAGGPDKLSNVELGKRLDNMMAEREVSGWFQTDKRAFEMTLDEAKIEDIPASALAEIKLAVAPEVTPEMTPEQITDLIRARYLAALRAGLYAP